MTSATFLTSYAQFLYGCIGVMYIELSYYNEILDSYLISFFTLKEKEKEKREERRGSVEYYTIQAFRVSLTSYPIRTL